MQNIFMNVVVNFITLYIYISVNLKYICIGGEKMSLLLDVIMAIITFYPRNDMKLKHHIAKLSEFEWFRNLHEDPKYTRLI